MAASGSGTQKKMEITLFNGSKIKLVDFDVPKDLPTPEEMLNFGLKNSHIYREMLFKMFQTAEMTPSAVYMVYYFTTAIKNRQRILTELENHSETWGKADWFTLVQNFFNNFVVQFTDVANKFPVVNIPNTFPTVAAHCWIMQRKKKERTVEEFLKNQWAAQLDLSDELQAKQKEWEEGFWTNTVTSTTRDQKNRPKIEFKFYENFYANKSADKYPMMNGSMTKEYKELTEKSIMECMNTYPEK